MYALWLFILFFTRKQSLEEQERKLEEDFAAYLKKREMALEAKFKASAKLVCSLIFPSSTTLEL